MKRTVAVGVAVVSMLLAGAAQALTVSSASVGGGVGCSAQNCGAGTQTLAWSSNSGGGSGTLDIVGNSLSFTITTSSTTFLPVSGGNDNGVTQLVFSNTTYTGTATLNPLGGGFFMITSGSASISGTQTPSGAGTAGPFSASDSLLSGTCQVAASTVCGITFATANDFDFDVNGQTRYFRHTMNVTAVPEPATAALLGLGLFGLGLAGRRQ